MLARVIAERAPAEEIWRRRAFCALGDGDVALDDVIAEIRGRHYDGWIVVEQDTFPDSRQPARAARDQVSNREFLRARGL
jgi:inosose dehydratase